VSAHETIAATLRSRRFRYATEAELQAAIFEALFDEGYLPEREAHLDSGDRIDVLCGRVGIEVKVAGSARGVLRQLRRYAKCEELDALILVTDRVNHLGVLQAIDSKPVEVVSLAEAGL